MITHPRKACTFRLDGRLYGFEIGTVREVHPMAPWVRVPLAPAGFQGLVNLRGRIHLILDIRHLLGLPSKATAETDLLILFNDAAGPSFGVSADEIGEIVSLDGASLEDAGPLVEGAVAVGGEMLTLVRAEALLGAAENNGTHRGDMK
jgi:purine-binding chemotaxis protein CheW